MRVLLADDHSIIRNALKLSLQDLNDSMQFEEARSYGALEARLSEAEGPPLNMVVMDLQMPGYQGLDQIRRLVDMAAPTPVAVFSMMESPEDMRAVLRQGIRAFIPKSTDEALISTLLKLVAGGGTYVPAALSGIAAADGSALAPGPDGGGLTAPVPDAASSLPGGLPGTLPGATMATDSRLDGLTRRQREVLNLMSQGLSNMEIGNRMGLNLSTVKTHVTGILKALEVDNRTQAVLLARGLTPR